MEHLQRCHLPDRRADLLFAAGYTWRLRPGERYLPYLGRKARRLLVPYFAVAVLFLGLKLVPSLLMPLVNPVTWASVVNILVDPLHSYMPLLWFLYSLFCIQAVSPALEQLGPRTFPGLILAAALLPLPSTRFCLGPTWGSLPYFLIGVYVAEVWHLRLDQRIPRWAGRWVILCVILFCCLPVLKDLPFLLRALPAIALGVYLPLAGQGLVIRMQRSWPRWQTALRGDARPAKTPPL